AREANGGACGVATQAATSNFKTNEVAETTTDLAATSPSAGKVTLTATVGSTTGVPSGTVTFTEGEDVVAEDVAIVAGQAKVTLSGVEAGSHTYTATLTPGEGFLASSDDATVVVSDEVAIKAKAKTVKKGKNAKVKVTIAGAEGEVALLKGTKEIDSSMLKSGKATLVAKKVKKTTKYTVAFGEQTTKVTVKVKKK
ncbi:Ig-like domain-containing protein, partial [uncultured Nocardioides sp.]